MPDVKVLLDSDSEDVRSPCCPQFEEHFLHVDYRLVEGPGGIRRRSGVVSRAGLVLLRHPRRSSGLTSGLSQALATPRFLVHDPGQDGVGSGVDRDSAG